MHIQFIAPPEEKARGGIDNAVGGLASALDGTGQATIDILRPDDYWHADGHRHSPDVVHFHGLWNPSHAKISRELRKKRQPYVVSPHGMLEPWAWRNRIWKKLPYFHLVEKRHLQGAESIMVTSALEQRNLALRVDHPSVHPIALGCQDPHAPAYGAARKTLGWQPDQPVLLYLSRIDRKKCIDRMFRALADIPEKAQRWRLVVVGDGDEDYLTELQALADSLSEKLPAIEWRGGIWGDERWSYLQGADLFCLPTHSENFGIAVLEAMHAGTPVITTDQTPWADLSASPGVSISKTDIPSMTTTLSAAMEEATNWSDSARQNLSDVAADGFSWPTLAKQYLDVYRGVLATRA